MKLIGTQINIYISNDDKNTYYLISNFQKDTIWLDVVEMTKQILHLENDILYYDAYNIYNQIIPESIGVYINNTRLEKDISLYPKITKVMQTIAIKLQKNNINPDDKRQ